jgi:2-haloacid dehalogenase
MQPNPSPTSLAEVDTLTFDCYGTLIDWHDGLQNSFLRMFGEGCRPRLAELSATYVAVEAEFEGGEYQPYSQILVQVAERLAEQFGLPLPPGGADPFPRLLPDWKPFADTNDALRRLKQRFRLGVLSNIDRDLFAKTARHFAVPLDFVVTAEDVRSYKPSAGHFDALLRSHSPASKVLHVAQSQYHDGRACKRHGLPFVWINRYNDVCDPQVPMLAEFPDLQSFAAWAVS